MGRMKEHLMDVCELFGGPISWANEAQMQEAFRLGELYQEIDQAAARHGRKAELDSQAGIIRIRKPGAEPPDLLGENARLRRELHRVYQKIDHGCIDQPCKICDAT